MIHRLISDYKAPAGTAITFWGFNFMTNFSETKFYCSLVSILMSEVNGKSPYEKWQDAVNVLSSEEEKYAAMENKEMKSAKNKFEKIQTLKQELEELALVKDDDVLSEACKKDLAEFYGWIKYNKWIAPESPANGHKAKGHSVEDLSIQMVNNLDGTNYLKNSERFENEYIIGVPDIIDYEKNVVIDVKSSWNMNTFMGNLAKELNKSYWWQAQGYMALLNFPKAEINFCLITTPEHIIQSEIERKAGDRYSEEEIRQNLTFDDIPEVERRLRFVVERDDEAIEKLYKRIRKCREYLSVIEELHLSMK